MHELKKKRLIEYFHHCPELVNAIQYRRVDEVQKIYDFYSERCISQ